MSKLTVHFYYYSKQQKTLEIYDFSFFFLLSQLGRSGHGAVLLFVIEAEAIIYLFLNSPILSF